MKMYKVIFAGNTGYVRGKKELNRVINECLNAGRAITISVQNTK